jgi:hypothetical protein
MKSLITLVLCTVFISACSATISSDTQQQDRTVAFSHTFRPDESSNLLSWTGENQNNTAPLLHEVQELVKRHQKSLTSGSGWWHRLTLHTNDNGNKSFYPKIIPNSFRLEEWFALDSQGRITTGVSRMSDEAGKTIQVSLLVNEIWHNLTFQAESPFDPIADFDLSSGFYNEAARLVQLDNHLNKQTLYNNCWYVGEQYRVLDGQVLHEAVFNPDSGKLRWIKTWDISTSALTLLNSIEVLNEEWVSQPPIDVLTQLEQAAAP